MKLGSQTNAWAINPANIDSLYSVLDRIRQVGLIGFETGFRNVQSHKDDLKVVRGRLQATGLTFFGIHIFLSQYDPTTYIAPESLYTEVAQIGAALGAENLILSGTPAGVSEAGLSQKASGLNAAGRVASQQGLRVAYHNHAPEFQNDAREIRFLIENTDPGLVSFVIDAGHAFRAGADIPSFVSAHASRLAGIHLRDSRGGTEVPLGAGDFPLAETAAALRKANWTGWALLEEERVDGSKPGDNAIVPAAAALRRAFNV